MLKWWTNLSTNELAAWVQAVGSVLAIIAAIVIAGHEHRSAIRREEEAERRRRDRTGDQCIAFSADLIACLLQIRGATSHRDSKIMRRQEGRLRDLVEFARSISLMDLPPAAVLATLKLRGMAVQCAADASLLVADGSVDAYHNANYSFALWLERVEEADATLHQALG